MAPSNTDRAKMPPPHGSPSASAQPVSSSSSPPRTRAYSDSTAFSESVKLETKRLSNHSCWSCNTERPQICHVVAKEDSQTVMWEQAGLFQSFTYNQVANAISLCPTCHVEFDLSLDPGYIFFPTDLKFFIEFEIQDCERRRIAADNGQPIERRVPTASDYLLHQQTTGVVSSDAIGGLYRRVFLKNFLLGGAFNNVVQSLATPKQWHGYPLASIRRAMAVPGSPRKYVLDFTIREDLEQLSDLYFGGEPLSSTEAFLRETYRLDAPGNNKRKLEDEDESERAEKKPKNQEIKLCIDRAEGDLPNSQLTRRQDWVNDLEQSEDLEFGGELQNSAEAFLRDNKQNLGDEDESERAEKKPKNQEIKLCIDRAEGDLPNSQPARCQDWVNDLQQPEDPDVGGEPQNSAEACVNDLQQSQDPDFGGKPQNPADDFLRDNKRNLGVEDESERAGEKPESQEIGFWIDRKEGNLPSSQFPWCQEWVLGPYCTANLIVQRYSIGIS